MLNERHSTEADYKERMSVHDWMKILKEGRDTVTFNGQVVQLRCNKLGCGIVEVGK